ncbi:MAG: hypothetical protein IH596_06400 [Bacteroidales bacterium]|nr:hypothetical protein [Bacteroidales bacterium]
MMKRTFYTITLAMFIGLGTLMAQSHSNMVIQFQTLGNCAICKIRIEAKLALTEGVIAADWDYNNDVTTVEYDEEVTDAFQIMHAVADTGHDTEWYAAPDSMYALLIGSCCEYERTINYSNVQIGYLSLMGLWVYPVGITEIREPVSVSLYPTIASDAISVELKGSMLDQNALLTIYSMKGTKMCEHNLAASEGNRIDVSSMANGQYLAVVSIGSEICSRTKIIITH